MKRKLIILLALSLLTTSLAACGNSSSSDSGASNALLQLEKDVTITIPGDYIGDTLQETLTEEQLASGYKSATKNEDGSVTYVMTASAHKALLDEYASSLDGVFNKLINDGTYKSFKRIEHNADFTEITAYVDQAAFKNSMDSFASLAIYIAANLYQVIDGKSDEDIRITLRYIDDATNTEFDTITLPDDFSEESKSAQ